MPPPAAQTPGAPKKSEEYGVLLEVPPVRVTPRMVTVTGSLAPYSPTVRTGPPPRMTVRPGPAPLMVTLDVTSTPPGNVPGGRTTVSPSSAFASADPRSRWQ